jgi:hypothetical protein
VLPCFISWSDATSLGNIFLATLLASASAKATFTCLRRRQQQQHAHPTHATATLASPVATIIAPVILPDGFPSPTSGIGRLHFDGAIEESVAGIFTGVEVLAFVGHTTGSWRNKVGFVVYLLGEIETSIEGVEVGATLFHFDGKLEWSIVGGRVGGEGVGYFVLGFGVDIVGDNVGEYVGNRVGKYDGAKWVGCCVTCGIGALIIINVGNGFGLIDGFKVGGSVGLVGFRVLTLLGVFEGTMEGIEDGFVDGDWDGLGDSVG